MKNPNKVILFIFSVIVCIILYSCASIGNPAGGPRDEEPPRYVQSNPPLGATNINTKRIEIEFDEIVNVKDAFSKVVTSPTSKVVPKVSSQGKKVVVQFDDTLQSNTTYTIDFSNAIEDNNESNKIPNYAFWFSTGETIDTLQISGMVLAARNLEPQQGMLVGVHSNFADSAFKTTRLERVAKTDDRGRFTIRNLKPGNYKIFALADVNNDYRWDNPAEDIAFLETTISPYSEQTTSIDTLYDIKNSKIDTIVTRARTRFLPNDVLLSSFNIEHKTQYLVKNERIDSTRISLIFNAKSDTLPTLRLVSNPDLKDWYLLERNRFNDTLTYWLKPNILTQDTLVVATTYQRADSAQNIVWGTDTIKFITPKAKTKSKKKKKTEEADSLKKAEIRHLAITPPSTNIEYYNPLFFTFDEPIEHINQSAIHLEIKSDTLWKPADKNFTLQKIDSLAVIKYKIDYPWEFGGEYKLSVDSAAIVGIYGHHNKPLDHTFQVKKEDEYSNFTFTIEGLPDSIPAFVEFLNASDSPIRTAKVVNGVADFLYLAPGSYYARIIEDTNGNGEYDTGDYDTKRQPEFAYYYPKKINIKKNWEITQTWNVFETAIDLQKPEVLKKNKPEASKHGKKKQQNEEEEEDEESFDVNSNPFDPNSNQRSNNNRY